VIFYRTSNFYCGRLAQLVERLVYTEDVGGSSPSSPRYLKPAPVAGFLVPANAVRLVYFD
jgi:hypothetical protein